MPKPKANVSDYYPETKKKNYTISLVLHYFPQYIFIAAYIYQQKENCCFHPAGHFMSFPTMSV